MKLNHLLPMLLVCAVLPCHSESEAAAGKSYVLVSEKPERIPGLAATFSDEMTMKMSVPAVMKQTTVIGKE